MAFPFLHADGSNEWLSARRGRPPADRRFQGTRFRTGARCGIGSFCGSAMQLPVPAADDLISGTGLPGRENAGGGGGIAKSVPAENWIRNDGRGRARGAESRQPFRNPRGSREGCYLSPGEGARNPWSIFSFTDSRRPVSDYSATGLDDRNCRSRLST